MADLLPAYLEIILTCYFGLVLGSFATAIAHREANGESWFSLKGRKAEAWSKCPHCHHRLTLIDLIPVLSWALSKGKCRHCGAPVSVRYPVIELMCMAACLGLYFVHDFTWALVPLLFLVPFLFALFWVDLDVMLLPNRLVGICFLFAAMYIGRVFLDTQDMDFLIDHAAGMVIYPAVFGLVAFIMTKILKKSALGMGDVKFLVPAGLLAGFQLLPAYLILSGILGVASALVIRKVKGTEVFPFGPALILALYAILLLS